jgi:hypothetical protein
MRCLNNRVQTFTSFTSQEAEARLAGVGLRYWQKARPKKRHRRASPEAADEGGDEPEEEGLDYNSCDEPEEQSGHQVRDPANIVLLFLWSLLLVAFNLPIQKLSSEQPNLVTG